MKKKASSSLMLLALLIMLAPVAPATAQEAPPSVEQTDLVAQLTVECPENAATLEGYQLVTTGVESLTAVPLTDEDGDGVLTATQTFPRFPRAHSRRPTVR